MRKFFICRYCKKRTSTIYSKCSFCGKPAPIRVKYTKAPQKVWRDQKRENELRDAIK